MSAHEICIRDLADLRHHVHETICTQHELEVGAFPMTERILVRDGRSCGIFFCLHGPRSVKLTAIWETDRNTVLYYGSTGERLLRMQLVEAPTHDGDTATPGRYEKPPKNEIDKRTVKVY